MLIRGDNRASRLDVCVAAANQFLLSGGQARAVIDGQVNSIRRHWNAVCGVARLSAVAKASL
jgi:serine/threonine-protein kinase HipA